MARDRASWAAEASGRPQGAGGARLGAVVGAEAGRPQGATRVVVGAGPVLQALELAPLAILARVSFLLL